MKWTKSDYLFFFDRWVIPMIAEEYQLDEETAFRQFINSQTYNLLSDDTTKLFRESPLFIFDMFKAECETGDPRNSSYIKDYE
ncbi:MAG: hypothetical protein FWF70_06765 [Bacteroidetes bacterium]|nr:hypothetical protein [Bacteroidota bacterium]MCL1968701.1 hypothetical protein [Bacteroidota bacterium]